MRPIAWLWIAAVATGCLTRTAPARLASPTPVAVAYLVDDEQQGTVSPVPASFEVAVARALKEHNLEAQSIPFDPLAQSIRGRRDSMGRYEEVRRLAPDVPFLLLVESKARFFSQLNGRYRWEVSARVSAGRRGAPGGPVHADIELPALLEYFHERAPEALGDVAPQIAERISALFAGLIGAPD